jgi:hypothetical protein
VAHDRRKTAADLFTALADAIEPEVTGTTGLSPDS